MRRLNIDTQQYNSSIRQKNREAIKKAEEALSRGEESILVLIDLLAPLPEGEVKTKINLQIDFLKKQAFLKEEDRKSKIKTQENISQKKETDRLDDENVSISNRIRMGF